MTRILLSTAALVGLVLLTQPSPVIAQTSQSPAATAPSKAPAAAKAKMRMMSRKTMPGHRLDNIADKLNTCQGRPQAERQPCMDQATHP